MNGIGTAPKLSHKADTSLTPDNVAYNTVIKKESLSLIFRKPRFLSSCAVPCYVIWLMYKPEQSFWYLSHLLHCTAHGIITRTVFITVIAVT
jgi:hypothetical protein